MDPLHVGFGQSLRCVMSVVTCAGRPYLPCEVLFRVGHAKRCAVVVHAVRGIVRGGCRQSNWGLLATSAIGRLHREQKAVVSQLLVHVYS